MAWTAETLLTTIGKHGLAECITEARLSELTGLDKRQVDNACHKLRRHGFITRVGAGCHRLTDAGKEAITHTTQLRSGPKGPETGHRRRSPGMRQRIWNALRTGKKMTIDDIILLVADGDEADPRSNVGKYVRGLAKAGYVIAMPVREAPLSLTSNGAIRWWLVTDTGPAAPVLRVSRQCIYDPNLEKDIAMVREITS